jgi:hypothetical protein
MDLPPAGAATPYRGSRLSGASSDVQLASATEAADGPSQ